MLAAVVSGLESIGILSKTTGDGAEAALKAVGSIVDTLMGGFAGDVKPDAIIAAFATLKGGITAERAGADKALLARFTPPVSK